jgi:hypothetical protein
VSRAPSSFAALAVAVSLCGGCVGAHGTRGRAYAIDAALAVAGGTLVAVGLNSNVGAGNAFGVELLGFPIALAGTAGAMLTVLGQIGETRHGDGPALIAVRPWTAATDRAPFDPASVPAPLADDARAVLDAARAKDCDAALEGLDELYPRDRAVHARLARDPSVARCIVGDGTP